MARQLRNKRKKSPSVAVTVEDTGTVQGTPLQSLPNAADDVLGCVSFFMILSFVCVHSDLEMTVVIQITR